MDSPWKSPQGVNAVTQQWVKTGKVRHCLTADELLPGEEAQYRPLPPLHPGLVQALKKRQITQLFSHQAEAIESAQEGKHTVIATPTASGKSLCFHLPVLQALSEDPTATALFIYPTKALSRDQEHGLHQMQKESGLPT
ncbi:MAG: DEAD/DEAH box helicase, partial [Polyangiaceae bacterium]|nr:DEAD/DEAH box helicase [Polyangiaceae bacterium]